MVKRLSSISLSKLFTTSHRLCGPHVVTLIDLTPISEWCICYKACGYRLNTKNTCATMRFELGAEYINIMSRFNSERSWKDLQYVIVYKEREFPPWTPYSFLNC